jgi:hypothetical protein
MPAWAGIHKWFMMQESLLGSAFVESVNDGKVPCLFKIYLRLVKNACLGRYSLVVYDGRVPTWAGTC